MELSGVSWRPVSAGIEVFFDKEGGKVPVAAWAESPKTYIADAQWILIKELLDNGQAEIGEYEVLLPNETIGALSATDINLLGLPGLCPYDLMIATCHGQLQDKDLKYHVSFRDLDGEPVFCRRLGHILEVGNNIKYLLTSQQVELLDFIEDYNEEPEKDKGLSSNLLALASIKEKSKELGVFLEKYLIDTDVIVPQRISLHLNRTTELLEILPELEAVPTEENNEFVQSFDRYKNVRDVYTLARPDGKRTRIVLGEKQKEALNTVKANRRVKAKDAHALTANPELFFDPEIVNLDLSFSERVREIGFYKPRIYPFIAPYKSQWLPGLAYENHKGEQNKVTIDTQEELKALEALVTGARLAGKPTVKWKDAELPVEEVEKRIPFLRRQLEKGTRPEKGERTEDGEPVLIIDEHIEDTGATARIPEGGELLHRYQAPPDLKKDTATIYPHQQEGIAWLQSLYADKHPGCLLADDMGLGKTLQVLGFINWHHDNCKKTNSKKNPYLIVAPVTLLENWENEYRKFFESDLKMIALYGGQLEKFKTSTPVPLPDIAGASLAAEARKRRGALDVVKLSQSDMVLTTYETMRDFQLDLGQVFWDTIVLDEAQKIKSPGTLVTNAAKALKGSFKIACTGTPVENSLVDLWCITDFAVPGYLGSAKEFASKYQKALSRESTDSKQVGEDVRKQIGIYLKRRLKNDILEDLPSKDIHIIENVMPEVQRQRYDGEINAIQSATKESASEGKILQAIRLLRKISDHPFMEHAVTSENVDEYVRQSAKLTAAVEILEMIKQKNEKVILFSESRETCQMLQRVISYKFELPIETLYIVNGEMPATTAGRTRATMSRQVAVNRFEAKPGFNVIIMSPLAAGVGLNITGANHVIHYSRWWNPAKEDQATDRVYRIGQKLPVHVYVPLSTHPEYASFDKTLESLLGWKRSVMQDTLFPTEKAEVTPAELFQSLTQNITARRGEDGTPLALKDIEQIDPYDFEALVARIYKKSGRDVLLTPRQSDKGVDVVVLPKAEADRGTLVQVKHARTGRGIGIEAVREVYAARKFFEEKYLAKFDCCVVTNVDYLQDTAILARTNGVKLFNGEWLGKELKKVPIYWPEVTEQSLQRMASI